MQVNMLEAKNQLSKLVKAARAGEEVVIANHGTPVARIVAIERVHTTTGFGSMKGVIEYADDWDSPETNAAIADAMHASVLFPARSRKRVTAPSPRAAKAARRKP